MKIIFYVAVMLWGTHSAPGAIDMDQPYIIPHQPEHASLSACNQWLVGHLAWMDLGDEAVFNPWIEIMKHGGAVCIPVVGK